jgi:tetratricopeptide (TPR) repeat protein/predicted Ser/Thr protein kinase
LSDIGQHPSAQEPLPRGTEVGRFVVFGMLGRGAMGEVYAAHDPELDRTVAIKLLRTRSGWSTASDGRARLMREAQAIAKVSHPNVVVVFDVGTFDGRVFIAMEFVEGHTLGYWLQAGRRTLVEILDVFTAAGRGLQAAHEKGLVHRDFKPENVMVGVDGTVHVMDFGLVRLPLDRDERSGEPTAMERRSTPVPIADAEDPMATRIINAPTHARSSGSGSTSGAAMASNLTQTGSIMGTPAYMSPEQFRGEHTDARTDQFSFCVALYEALYGERPFAGTNVADLAESVTNGMIRPGPAASEVPASIRGALIRGMSPDPEQRFPSMNVLLAEIRQEPALAAARKFAAGAAAKLEGIWEVGESKDAGETRARVETRRAFLATGKPYAATTFEAASRILDRFAHRWTELYVDTCKATHLRGEQSTDALDLRMGALEEALGDLRALCRQFRCATPDLVENAVQAANALGTLERCADIELLRAIVRPPDDPLTRTTVEELRVRLSEVRTSAHMGRIAEGLKAAVAIEGDARKTGYAPLLAEVLLALGLMQSEVSDIEKATRTLEDAVWTAVLCRHDEIVAQATACLIFVAGHAQSKFDVGEIWSRHAEAVLGRIGGHDLVRGWLYNNRGVMRATQGRLHDATADMQLAIEAKQKALGPDDPDVAVSINNVAIYFAGLGEVERAAEHARRAVKIMESSLGLDHPRAAPPLVNYAEFLNRLGRFEEAREAAERALAVFERETDPNGVYVAYPLSQLGLSQIGMGRFEQAIAPLERAVRIREAKEGIIANLAQAHFGLAQALWGTGQVQDCARAHALAVKARAEYLKAPATPETAHELAEIDLWLASRGEHGPSPLVQDATKTSGLVEPG